ncbi:MAG: protein kinase domain-containing protein [Planctomycetota bacterium]
MSEAKEQNNKRPEGGGAGPTRSFDGSAAGPGSQIGPFRIERELGRGAVGVVYLAHDTKLDRSVAIKSLPADVMANPKARSRFSREARVLASLNHPNIATIYEELDEAEGVGYLILEYIPGQTLAERIGRGSLKLEEVLSVALQIAEAVAAAHEHDVIHRDLKPGNIKITPEGKVKVLDFGLAKAVGSEAADQQSTVTEPGRVIGTPAYMSPEQARGKPTDKRSDIWSFGCVLYEMLSGRVPFKGETISDTLANILQTDPDWHALPEATPANIRSLLRHCLKKEPRRRLQHIGDASIEIDETLNLPATARSFSTAIVGKSPSALWRSRIIYGVAGLMLGSILTGMATWSIIWSRPTAPPDVIRSKIEPVSKIADEALWHVALAISPDGKRIAYVDQGTGTERMLYVHELNTSEARVIPGTEGAIDPFFSPDGRSLGYSDHTRGALKVVSIRGGSPTTLAEAPSFSGGIWLDDGTIIFSPGLETGLWSISAAGGTSRSLIALDHEEGEVRHRWPALLPNDSILFTSYREKQGTRESRLEVVSRADGTRRVVLNRSAFGRYVPSGHLVFVRNGSLFGARFDLKALTLQGNPVPLLERVLHNPIIDATQLTYSNTGILAFIPAASSNRELVWVDDRGLVEPLRAPRRAYEGISLAPGGTQIAVSIDSQYPNPDISADVWLYDIPRGTLTQLTFNGMSTVPQWLGNSRQLAYLKYDPVEEMHDLLCLHMDGSRDEDLLARVPEFFSSGYSIDKDLTSVLGAVFLPINDQNIVAIDLRNGDRDPRTVAGDASWQRGPVFSPDGRWFAYSSHETGTWEVYVKPFPGSGAKIPISDGGGYEPVWDPHSDKLYYRNADKMWMVTYEAGEKFEPAQPKFLFERHLFGGLTAKQETYCVAKDGRFLMIQEDLSSGTQINVVTNWFEELKRLVPTGKNR